MPFPRGGGGEVISGLIRFSHTVGRYKLTEEDGDIVTASRLLTYCRCYDLGTNLHICQSAARAAARHFDGSGRGGAGSEGRIDAPNRVDQGGRPPARKIYRGNITFLARFAAKSVSKATYYLSSWTMATRQHYKLMHLTIDHTPTHWVTLLLGQDGGRCHLGFSKS